MSVFYSWTARLNYIVYNVMLCLLLCGVLSHLSERFGHLAGLKQKPIGLDASNVTFELREVD